MPETRSSPTPIDPELFRNIDPDSNDFQVFNPGVVSVDDSEEWFGVVSDVYEKDLWVVKLNAEFVTDTFTLYLVTLQTDSENVLFQTKHEDDSASKTLLLDGSTILDGNSAPGNIDLQVEQADTSNGAVDYVPFVTGYRIRKDPRAADDGGTPPVITGTTESFDT